MADDSYIIKLEKWAYDRYIGSTLAARNVQHVKWIHRPGMHWHELLPNIQYQAIHSYPPQAIVIHVGSNDLPKDKGVNTIRQMRDDLQHLVDNFPNTKIMFSAMLPRMVWTGTKVLEKMELKRKFIKTVIRRFLLYKITVYLLNIPKLLLIPLVCMTQMVFTSL